MLPGAYSECYCLDGESSDITPLKNALISMVLSCWFLQVVSWDFTRMRAHPRSGDGQSCSRRPQTGPAALREGARVQAGLAGRAGPVSEAGGAGGAVHSG